LITITCYTKPNCPLCDEALEVITQARSIMPFRLEQVNILTDLRLFEEYRNAIPVICLNGEEVFRHRVCQKELLQLLRQQNWPLWTSSFD
jgi:glutaredoxin